MIQDPEDSSENQEFRMLYLDCSYGVSGDMIVGSLIDLGANPKVIKDALSKIAKIKIKKVIKSKIKSTKFDVKFDNEPKEYVDLIKIIENLKISKKAKDLSKNILKTLATAESKVHKVKLNDVHLHGASDSVVDAVAVSLALEDLNLLDSEIHSSVVSVGRLAPATLEIIKDSKIPIKIISDDEIATPTGVAILSAIVTDFNEIRPNGKIGYGAGTRDFKYPNVLKAVRGSKIVLLETNIDDSTPEQISYLMERVMESGALDIHVIQCGMKKGRLGYLIRILTDNPEKFSKILFEETSTLGVRIVPIIKRFESTREIKNMKISINGKKEKIRVKKSPHGSKPEFDDVKRIAKKYKIPFREIQKRIENKI